MHTNVYFFTASIYKWKTLLLLDNHKDIIIDSMKFLVEDRRAKIYAFVIMPNHIHLVWEILEPYTLPEVQRDFLKYTGQKLKFSLIDNNSPFLESFRVDSKDREYQIWQRSPLSVEMYSLPVIEQKINYIHGNPVNKKWNLVENLEDYKYSSAKFYYKDIDEWGFLTHYMDYE